MEASVHTLRDEGGQLTFDVGEGPDEIQAPKFSTFSVGGALQSIDQQLLREDRVMVTITGEDGQVIARRKAYVTQIAFKTHEPPDTPKYVERNHKLKVI